MNTEDSKAPGAPQAGDVKNQRPPFAVGFVLAVISAAAAALTAQAGFFSIIALSAFVIYLSSAGFGVAFFAFPAAGLVLGYFYGGPLSFAAATVAAAASLCAGFVLRRGGDFHRALMTFTLLAGAAVAIGGAIYTKIYNISASDIYDAYTGYIEKAVNSAVSSSGVNLTLDNARILTDQYEAVMQSALLYLPAVCMWVIEICGLVALRINGLLHDLTGSTLYPVDRRRARVSRVFAVLFIVSLVMGSAMSGLAGSCAGNIMLSLLIPAAAAGFSSIVRNAGNRSRLSGRRGIHPVIILLIILSFIMYPAMAMIVLALIGAVSSFRKTQD